MKEFIVRISENIPWLSFKTVSQALSPMSHMKPTSVDKTTQRRKQRNRKCFLAAHKPTPSDAIAGKLSTLAGHGLSARTHTHVERWYGQSQYKPQKVTDEVRRKQRSLNGMSVTEGKRNKTNKHQFAASMRHKNNRPRTQCLSFVPYSYSCSILFLNCFNFLFRLFPFETRSMSLEADIDVMQFPRSASYDPMIGHSI